MNLECAACGNLRIVCYSRPRGAVASPVVLGLAQRTFHNVEYLSMWLPLAHEDVIARGNSGMFLICSFYMQRLERCRGGAPDCDMCLGRIWLNSGVASLGIAIDSISTTVWSGSLCRPYFPTTFDDLSKAFSIW